MTTATATRTFSIDKAHSEATFQVRHLISKVRGRFADFEGAIAFDEAQPEHSAVEFTIQAASIDTNTPDRDAHLRSEDFFAVDKYPTITFVSTAISPKGRGASMSPATLTMRGVTREVVIPIAYPRNGHGSVGQPEDRLRGRGDAQPEGLRPELERRHRDRRVPGRRRGEGEPVDSGRGSEVRGGNGRRQTGRSATGRPADRQPGSGSRDPAVGTGSRHRQLATVCRFCRFRFPSAGSRLPSAGSRLPVPAYLPVAP